MDGITGQLLANLNVLKGIIKWKIFEKRKSKSNH